DVDGYRATRGDDLVELEDRDAMAQQPVGARLRARHRPRHPVAHAGQQVDEVVDRRAGADADDLARMQGGERRFGRGALERILVHVRVLWLGLARFYPARRRFAASPPWARMKMRLRRPRP